MPACNLVTADDLRLFEKAGVEAQTQLGKGAADSPLCVRTAAYGAKQSLTPIDSFETALKR